MKTYTHIAANGSRKGAVTNASYMSNDGTVVTFYNEIGDVIAVINLGPGEVVGQDFDVKS